MKRLVVSLTFEEELLGNSVSFVLVHINHSHFGAGFTQCVSEGTADALAAARHVGHLPVQTHAVEDGLPLHPAENHIVHYFILIEKKTHAHNNTIKCISKKFPPLVFLVFPDGHLRLEALRGPRYPADDAEAIAERKNDLMIPKRQALVNEKKKCCC